MVEFSERLKDLMSYFNISQADISARTGINRSLISHYIKGDRVPKQDKILTLHQTYGVSIQWLLGYDYPMFEKKEQDYAVTVDDTEIQIETVSPKPRFNFGKTNSSEETKRILEQDKIDVAIEIQKEHDEEYALNKLKKLTQITSALATMSDEDFEMVYKLAIRLSK